MFNLKVALPMHQGDDSMGNIYEELFRNKASRKFTMILKKHMNQMDLYDSRMLSEYTKRITYLETQFLRSQAIAS